MAESGPGAKTSEFWLTRLVVSFGIALTAAGVVLPHLDAMFGDLHGAFPESLALVKVGAIVAVMAKTVYALGRLFLKARQIQADATVQLGAQGFKSPR